MFYSAIDSRTDSSVGGSGYESRLPAPYCHAAARRPPDANDNVRLMALTVFEVEQADDDVVLEIVDVLVTATMAVVATAVAAAATA